MEVCVPTFWIPAVTCLIPKDPGLATAPPFNSPQDLHSSLRSPKLSPHQDSNFTLYSPQTGFSQSSFLTLKIPPHNKEQVVTQEHWVPCSRSDVWDLGLAAGLWCGGVAGARDGAEIELSQ